MVWGSMFYSKLFPIIFILLLTIQTGCAAFGIHSRDKVKPISNPFYNYRQNSAGDPAPSMILRTKKGDRSVELEIPEDPAQMSDFVLPVSPAFKEYNRSLASIEPDGTYQHLSPSMSDREITQSFSKSSSENELKRNEIEKGLNLMASADDTAPSEASSSYLGSLDHVKQLYRSSRYEAALLEVDGLIRIYQMDPKLYEMRGTLLDRLGKNDLAMKSWNQALRFNPSNESLKKFINRKAIQSKAGTHE